jgi:hypothetical protein
VQREQVMLPLKVFESRNGRVGDWSMVSMGQQTTASRAYWQARGAAPGSESASSLTTRVRGNQGDPIAGASSPAHLLTSLNREEEGGGDRKSEAPIRAMISGNAEGAKGAPV